MKVDIFGDRTLPKILLIHPSVADGRCFEPLYPYLKEYCLIVPTLNGHNIEDDSVYSSAKEEAQQILSFLLSNGITELHCMCAESLGCVVGWEILISRKLQIRKTVFDGAPFARFNATIRFLNYWMTIYLVQQCRKHPDKLKSIDETYPQVGDSMKQVLAHYSKQTIRNIVSDAMKGVEPVPDAVYPSDNLIVMYGSKDSYIRGLKFFEDAGYPFTRMVKDGYAHCTFILNETENFCKIITE